MPLQDAERRRDAMIGAALGAFNKKAKRMEEEREEARTLMDEMIAESKAREGAERRRQEAAAPWQMALSTGSTGAAIGSAIGGGPGAAIGAGIGAIGGGIYGAMAPQSVGRVAPYVGMAGQAAQAYQGMKAQGAFMSQQQKHDNEYLDFLRGVRTSTSSGGYSPQLGRSTGGSLPRFDIDTRLKRPTIG